MIVSRGNFTRVPQALTSSNGNGAYLGNSNFLVDGIPSTRCAILWPDGLQNSSVYVKLPWRMVPAPTMECRVFALLGLENVPLGIRVELYGGATSDPSTLLTLGVVELLPNGEYGVVIVREPGDGWTHEYYAWQILNDDGSSAPIAAEAVIYAGELYATPAWDWCVTDISIDMVDQSLGNTSAGGASRRVKWTPYRTAQVAIAPKGWDVAFIDSTNGLQALQYDLLSQDNITLIPRPRWPPGAGLSQESIIATFLFGVLTRVGGLTSNAQADRWPLQFAMQESP